MIHGGEGERRRGGEARGKGGRGGKERYKGEGDYSGPGDTIPHRDFVDVIELLHFGGNLPGTVRVQT